jgi:YebC/PmpR family DNA-binding regulatory protein
MSGHSKWSTIKRKKGALDAKRGKLFSKIVKEISVAVKESGADPESNPRLRLAIQNGKGVNMPKENIERAISKANKGGEDFQEITYEGYAPHGVGIFIECLTDNNLRSVSQVRSVFTKRGGALGTNGSLKFIFERKGVFTIKKGNLDPDAFELEIIDSGLEEFEIDEDVLIITTAMEDFGTMQKKLDEMKIEVENAQLQRIPITTKALPIEDVKKILRMVEEFEEIEDVQNVYHNLELTDELASALND